MNKPRRVRADTQAGQLLAFQSLHVHPEWPESVPHHHDPETAQLELERFQLILSRRAATDWRPHDFVVLARMAALEILIQNETVTLNVEGTLVTDHRGVIKSNQRVNVIQCLQSTLTTLTRQLGLIVPGNDRPALNNSAAAARAAAAAVSKAASTDDLLA